MNFSVNQATQVYYAGTFVVSGTVTAGSNVGAMSAHLTPDKKNLYFLGVGADAKVSRSDLICLDSIEDAVFTPSSEIKLDRPVYRVKAVSGGLIAGQDYIVKVVVNNYIGISKADSQFFKFGAVKADAAMVSAPKKFYVEMAMSLARSAGREETPLFNVYLSTSASATTVGGATQVTATTSKASLDGNYACILIEEVTPDWVLGVKQQKRMPLDVIPYTIMNSGVETVWADGMTDSDEALPSVGTSATPYYNGKMAADFEYFHMGERADQYRMVGWPDYIPTKYLVNPAGTYGFINLHYSYTGSNESIQKSEKDITIITPSSTGTAIPGIIATLTGKSFRVAGGTLVEPEVEETTSSSGTT